MSKYTETIRSDDAITLALHEFEEIYENLTMINQFFGYSIRMHPPHICINQLTYELAVTFSHSKNISKCIDSLFEDQSLLTDMIREILVFLCNNESNVTTDQIE